MASFNLSFCSTYPERIAVAEASALKIVKEGKALVTDDGFLTKKKFSFQGRGVDDLANILIPDLTFLINASALGFIVLDWGKFENIYKTENFRTICNVIRETRKVIDKKFPYVNEDNIGVEQLVEEKLAEQTTKQKNGSSEFDPT